VLPVRPFFRADYCLEQMEPSAAYYYFAAYSVRDAGWRLVGSGLADHDNDVIPAGSAIVIRKAKSATGQTTFWTNAPTY
jgi:hypothetical protein